MSNHTPPFDGQPCPMCPVEIRNLSATAHNLLNRWDAMQANPQASAELMPRVRAKMEDLRRAVEAVKPLSDKHFENRLHSHGENG